MAPLRLNDTVVLAPDTEVEHGYLAYDLASDRIHRLNPSAALVTELCDGTRGAFEVAAIVDALPGLSSESCRRWIDGAIREGLLTEAGDRPPAVRSTASIAERAARLRDKGAVLPAFICQWHAAHHHPDRADWWRELGELAHIVGRRGAARDAYTRYLTLHPDDGEIAHIVVSLSDGPSPARAPDASIKHLYARFAEFFEDNMAELEYRGPECLDRAIGRVLGHRSDLRIVELGCGTGLMGRLLRRRARSLVGIDLSAAMLERAAAAGVYDALVEAEITDWLDRERPGSADLVVACDTLIYFGDLRQVIAPAARLLQPGGRLAFTVEAGAGGPFALADSGRYRHHRDHVGDAATDAGMEVSHLSEAVLRHEYGEPVRGLVVVLSLFRQVHRNR